MANSIPDDKLIAISNAIFEGRKIEAIKLYREVTDVGLKEAKEQIEALESSLRKDHPEKFVGKGKGAGCGGAAVLVIGFFYWIAFQL